MTEAEQKTANSLAVPIAIIVIVAVILISFWPDGRAVVATAIDRMGNALQWMH